MSFRVPAEYEAIHEAVHEFGENEIRLVAEECTERERFPKDFLSQVTKYDLVALAIPKTYAIVGSVRSSNC
jgi:alkylation response protein AidB-like acyl-CoA dehydrogenase